jgi:hypothetical protein
MIADEKSRRGVAVAVFLSPVDLDCSKLGSSDIQAKHDAESGDDVGLGLKTSASGAKRKEIIRICGVLGVA